MVAPLVGAWIETYVGAVFEESEDKSLPSWERGLKPRPLLFVTALWPSLPSWERGLKP